MYYLKFELVKIKFLMLLTTYLISLFYLLLLIIINNKYQIENNVTKNSVHFRNATTAI